MPSLTPSTWLSTGAWRATSLTCATTQVLAACLTLFMMARSALINNASERPVRLSAVMSEYSVAKLGEGI